MKRGTDRDALVEELARLPTLDTPELRERWRQLYGNTPPMNLGRKILIGAVAYRLQENVYGGLKPATKRLLARVATEAANRGKITLPAPQFKPGTRLLREWQGVTHEVAIADEGVLYLGKRYRSLSEVARLITGSRWSGPRFFGLKADIEKPDGAKASA